MTKKLQSTLRLIAKDRILLIAMILVFLFGISFFLFVIFNVKQMDQLMYSRYTIYGAEHFYRDKWFYRIAIASFGLIISFVHNVIVVKLFSNSGRESAIVMAVFSIVVALIAFSIIGNVIQIPN